ncbi:MAG: hypothetical protein OQL19_17905 [Gammaproteobacteria bacterium]|nr:hypothetical protein [Gammaproteobacteria bacterium]
MNKLLLIGCSFVLIGGCNHLTVKNFDKSPLSAVTGNKVSVITQIDINEIKDPGERKLLEEYLKDNSEFEKALTKACTVGGQKVMIAPGIVPIATAFGKLMFDLQMDKNTKELEKLKKAANSSYSQRVILMSGEFKSHECALVYRYNPKTNKMGFIVVLDYIKYGNSFGIKPTYVVAHNTTAITKKSDSDKELAKINLSIAVSLKAIGSEKNGLPKLTSVGEGVVSVKNIELSEVGSNGCNESCDSSDLIPYLPSDSDYISITYGVTESGKIGVDLDERIAEYKAIKEAIGPALKETLIEYLKKDE